ncbi:phosphotransferase [Moraxella oculi]|uniref:Phosphotransferase n=1 Tax=Moraxella oculi TaxID=2940516 RepID=A0ABW8UCC6_9GAMM
MAMLFNKIIYLNEFSKVSESSCGRFVKKESRRCLRGEIEVLIKLTQCPYIPKLIDVVNHQGVILERLHPAPKNTSQKNISRIYRYILEYIADNQIFFNLHRFDLNFIKNTIVGMEKEVSRCIHLQYIFDLNFLMHTTKNAIDIIEKNNMRYKNFYLLHGDLHIGNIMMGDKHLKIIDWEDAILFSTNIEENTDLHYLYQVYRLLLFIMDFLEYGNYELLLSQKNKIKKWSDKILRDYQKIMS